MRIGKGLLAILMMCLILTGCGGAQENKTDASDPATTEAGETVQTDKNRQKEENEMSEKTMRVQIGAYTFTAALEDNAATEALTGRKGRSPRASRWDRSEIVPMLSSLLSASAESWSTISRIRRTLPM